MFKIYLVDPRTEKQGWFVRTRKKKDSLYAPYDNRRRVAVMAKEWKDGHCFPTREAALVMWEVLRSPGYRYEPELWCNSIEGVMGVMKDA